MLHKLTAVKIWIWLYQILRCKESIECVCVCASACARDKHPTHSTGSVADSHADTRLVLHVRNLFLIEQHHTDATLGFLAPSRTLSQKFVNLCCSLNFMWILEKCEIVSHFAMNCKHTLCIISNSLTPKAIRTKKLFHASSIIWIDHFLTDYLFIWQKKIDRGWQ